jgi:hypothetical protein
MINKPLLDRWIWVAIAAMAVCTTGYVIIVWRISGGF